MASSWLRHLGSGDTRFHAIVTIVFGGSVKTRCRGTWPASDAVEESESPADDQRCAGCQRVLVDLGMIERGLVELAKATP